MEFNQVKELIQIFEGTDLNNMEVKLGEDYVKFDRGGCVTSASEVTPVESVTPVVSTVTEPVTAQKTEETTVVEENAPEGTKMVTAPIVGTFYQASSPENPPFVKVGDTIAKGDVVCIIEAMKFMNEVTSEVSGTITEVLVEDGAFVEYGQELFRVK